jgi:hypothetical protein
MIPEPWPWKPEPRPAQPQLPLPPGITQPPLWPPNLLPTPWPTFPTPPPPKTWNWPSGSTIFGHGVQNPGWPIQVPPDVQVLFPSFPGTLHLVPAPKNPVDVANGGDWISNIIFGQGDWPGATPWDQLPPDLGSMLQRARPGDIIHCNTCRVSPNPRPWQPGDTGWASWTGGDGTINIGQVWDHGNGTVTPWSPPNFVQPPFWPMTPDPADGDPEARIPTQPLAPNPGGQPFDPLNPVNIAIGIAIAAIIGAIIGAIIAAIAAGGAGAAGAGAGAEILPVLVMAAAAA